MRICSIAKGPLKERAFLLAYEMASGNLKHCARVGRDQGGSIKGANVFSFNPRARAGRDASGGPAFCPHGRFNPRARVGRDHGVPAAMAWQERFNPRARVGRDCSGTTCWTMQAGFNPRARVGRDGRKRQSFGGLESVSIHAPARRATTRCFNPRARAGRDLSWLQNFRGVECFNPRARAGRDDPPFCMLIGMPVSIHAPARGATAFP